VNSQIIKLGVESGMLNYVDHETPRHYFLCGHADEECLERFAQLIVRECYEECKGQMLPDKMAESQGLTYNDGVMDCAIGLLQHFGIK